MTSAIASIFKHHGILGLWRGMSTTLVRLVVVSSVQLPTFAKARGLFKIENHTIKRTYKYSIIAEFVTAQGYFKEGSVINAFIASLLSGLLVSVAMAPFDLVSTRFYNQGVDANGKGMGKKLVNKLNICLDNIMDLN